MPATPEICTTTRSTTPPPSRSGGRPRARRMFVAATVAIALAGCSTDTKTLSPSNTLVPIGAATTTVPPPGPPTTTTPIATATTTVAPVTVATITAATMAPPMLSAPVTTLPPTVTVTAPPATTTPPTTAAPDTTPAPPDTTPGTSADTTPDTAAPVSCDSCRSDFRFPYASFFDVPQLGTEAVRGTGCGGNVAIGDVIPDGVWDGHITVSGSTLKIDLQCVYYGASAQPYIAQCEQTQSEDDCLEGGDQFWIVNNNTRLRSVPLDPSFRRRYANTDCADPGPGQGADGSDGADAMDSWVYIVNGKATFALTSCIYG
ncbi:MAG: hypothetical protein JWM34_3397 [Ilumatobacteraceae bacterium]|nr:hypothetical protein [Ilumatobacteraceae bacterium]